MTVELDGRTDAASARSISPPAATIQIGAVPAALHAEPSRARTTSRSTSSAPTPKRPCRQVRHPPLRAAAVMPGKRTIAWRSVPLVLAVFLAWPIWSFYQTAARRERYRPGLSMPTSCGRGQPVAGPCRRSRTIARPATSSRSSRCATPPARPATPAVHDHADLARLAARATRSRRLPPAAAAVRRPVRPDRRAAASNAIPSMRGRRRCRRRRSISAPTATPICAGAAARHAARRRRAISARAIPNSSRRC